MINPDFLNPEKLEKKPSRDGAGLGIVELGKLREDVCVITTDVAGSVRANLFAKEFPGRFIQLGVAEQNAIGVAAGLAHNGMMPYYFAYAAFAVGRTWEQIRTLLAYPKSRVRIAATHTGVSTGPDGATHQMTEDIAIMRCLPNMTVLSPADMEEARKAIHASASIEGPVYIRLSRAAFPCFTDSPFTIGKMNTLKEGTQGTIIATGTVVYNSLLAAHALEKKGISLRVLNCHTIKPLDVEAIRSEDKRIITIEDHQVAGGLGGAVAEVATVPVFRLGVPDRFGESGEADELYKLFSLDVAGIEESIRNIYET